MHGTYAEAVQRGHIGRVIVSTAAAVALIGTFLPWLRSGSRQRNSYDVFAIVERLGYSSAGVVGWALRLWPLFPLLVVGTATLLWFGRVRVGAAAGVVAALYAAAVSVTVLTASPSGIVSVRYGAWVTLAGAADLLIASGFTVVMTTTGRVPRAPHAESAGDPS